MVAVDDPVGGGLVASLARPGGNMTGSTWDVGVETYTAKTLAILKGALPKSARVAFLWRPDHPAARDYLRAYQNVAPATGLMLLSLPLSRAEELEDAFKQMVEQGADAVIVGPGHTTAPHRKYLTD